MNQALFKRIVYSREVFPRRIYTHVSGSEENRHQLTEKIQIGIFVNEVNERAFSHSGK